MNRPVSYKRHRFPPQIIAHAVWLYFRFPLSLRLVEEMLLERGVLVSYETVRRWALKFGPDYARRLRRKTPSRHDVWHLDEVAVTIAGQKHWLWRAVDQEGYVPDEIVQTRRNNKAAKRLLRRLLKKQGMAPKRIITGFVALTLAVLRNAVSGGAVLLSLFKRRRFPVETILLCVRWYCKYGISYRDLAEMMQERGVAVDPSTIFRWVQRYAPEIEKRVRRYQGYRSGSWRVDETYVRVSGKWKYLFRAVDKHGQLIDFMLSDRRNTKAAYRFLRKALKTLSDYPPSSITTDKLASYPKAIQRLQKDGLLSNDVEHRASKYLNNIIEADHGALKRVIWPTRGFQRMATASATIEGFEVMRMIRRGHCGLAQHDVIGEIHLVNQLFGLTA